MKDDRYYFTPRGIKLFRKKIEELEMDLKKMQADTAYIAEVGGNQYHDNASYECLIIDIRGVDWRISQMHQILNKAVIISSVADDGKVRIGTMVKIRTQSGDQVIEIVGYGESDPKANRIIYDAPLAALIMGKEVGDIVTGTIVGKTVEIEIIDISRSEAFEDG